MSDEIFVGLARAGWTPQPPRPQADLRAVRSRGASRLVLERHGKVLWLVIDEPGDRRVLGLEPTVEASAVVDAIVALQDTLSVASYLSAYGQLGAVGEVSIIAWEQFDPAWC